MRGYLSNVELKKTKKKNLHPHADKGLDHNLEEAHPVSPR